MCGERRDKNDVASFRQNRKELLDKKKRHPNVDGEESVEVFEGCFLNARCFRDSGIGDQDVENLSEGKVAGKPRRRLMSDDALLDQAAQLIADARVACLKLAIPPAEIAKIMMDEAILALMAERLSLSDIQGAFKKYTKRDLPRFYMNLKRLASDQNRRQAH